jgi:predicted RNA-binding Zn-ribbon protein involved in translation (DUF1610 family)/nitrate reductase NapE component
MRWLETVTHTPNRARVRRILFSLLSFAVLACLAFALVSLALDPAAFARPGGGHSYSGGSHSSGSSHSSSGSRSSYSGGSRSGGGDDIGIIIDIIVVFYRNPPLAAAVLCGFGIVLWMRRKAQGAGLPDWSVGIPQAQVMPTRPHFVAKTALDRLRGEDPNFSVVLFEDFLYTLYSTLHIHRGSRSLDKLAPYVHEHVRKALRDDTLQAVGGVVIGSMRTVALRQVNEFTQVEFEIESNLEETRGGKPERMRLVERVVLMRPRSARSRARERAQTLDCPNCGAALEAITGNTCSYCNERVDDGRFDWMIRAIRCVTAEKLKPMITSDVAERGTDQPTVVTPGAEQRLQAMSTHDPSFKYSDLLARAQVIFSELQAGWAHQDLLRIRPHVSDRLLQYFSYWFEYYWRAQARNITEQARVLHVDLANVISDNAYDAVTLRVFATGLDYTLANDGKLLSGSRSRERPYTEYWTLIRGRSAKTPAATALACPNCGAPLKINMAGHCEYCRAKVVSGDFDWVLSRIEQDDNYSG